MADMFVEISHELSELKEIQNGEWVTVLVGTRLSGCL
jgi:hypothetical protein